MEETRVKVSIEADKATGAVQAAGDELKKFGDQAKAAGEEAKKGAEGQNVMAEASEKLQEQLEALVGGAAIAAFFKGAVDASLEEAEALRQVKFVLESTGQSWEQYKDRVDQFAASQMALTQFDDGVTIQVLGRLARATGDVESAMRATALAQDIAAASGKDLGTTTDIINGLLTGQQRAVVQAQKEFAAYVGGAETTQAVLDKLAESFEGAAVKQDGHSKSLAQARHQLQEFQQRVGDGIVPVLVTLSEWVTKITMGWEMLGSMIAGVAAATTIAVQGMFESWFAVLRLQFGRAIEIAQETKEKLTVIDEETAADISAIQGRYDQEKTERVTNSAALVAQKSQEEVNAIRDAEAKKVAEKKKAEDLTKKLEEDRKKNFSSTLNFIATLSTAKNKELAIIGKAAALASAYINTAQAVTVALKSAPPPFNFALAAAVGAAGGVQIATIAGVQLEKGGVTTNTGQDGIFANIGEKGKPEAVLPLTDRTAMEMVGRAISGAGGIGGAGGGTVVFAPTFMVPGLESFRDPRLVQEVFEQFAEALERGGPWASRFALNVVKRADRDYGRAS